MPRPKGYSPPPCPECGNKGRHKVDCSKEKAKTPHSRSEARRLAIQRGAARAEAALSTLENPDLQMAPIHAYVSEKADYKCAEVGCGELLPITRQHYIDNSGRHLCIVHAAEVVRRRASSGT